MLFYIFLGDLSYDLPIVIDLNKVKLVKTSGISTGLCLNYYQFSALFHNMLRRVQGSSLSRGGSALCP